jgi:hypothetical protein
MTIRSLAILLTGFGVLVAPARAALDEQAGRFWPQWRGPHATGVSRTARPPLEWGEGKNIKWKVEIPGRGAASPVVWPTDQIIPTRKERGSLPPRLARVVDRTEAKSTLNRTVRWIRFPWDLRRRRIVTCLHLDQGG